MSDNTEYLKEAFPVGKLVDVQLLLEGPDAGCALMGLLAKPVDQQAKALFFDNVSIEKVGFTSYLCRDGGFSSLAAEALDLLKAGDFVRLEQFLLSHVHNSVGQGE